jgi:hypothetical protein
VPFLGCRTIAIRYADVKENDTVSECKHGLRHGCSYCHARSGTATRPVATGSKRPGKVSRLSDKMNDRMTALNQRLRKLRGE